MNEEVARNLRKAYTNFDPMQPLSGDSKFYIDRKNNPLVEMKWSLLNDNSIPQKILFSGHRGSGKSTELRRLTADQEIQEKYFVVHYSINDILDPADLKYTDLLFSIGIKIFTEAIESGLKLKKGIRDELEQWVGKIEIVREDTSKRSAETEASLGVSAFFAKLGAKLKLEQATREIIRQTIEPRVSELVSTIDRIIDDVKIKSGKDGVLVAVDDLDKPDLATAEELFYKHQTSLTQLKCSTIYTVPIAMHYSSKASGQVGRAFTESHFLPNVTIMGYDDRSEDLEGRALMQDFVLKRVSSDLIEDDALERAITSSGGVFREMSRIIRIASSKANARGADSIEVVDVGKAESQIRNEFRRMLEGKHYEELKGIYKDRDLRKGSDICADLMHNMSVLEYRNDENWCDVHPVIHPIIVDLIEKEKADDSSRG